MKISPRILAAGLAAALAALAPAASRADSVLYGTTLINDQLISINTATGTGTLIGPAGGSAMPFGLASYNGGLYTFDANTDSILRIDPATGSVLSSIQTTTGLVAGQGGFAIGSNGVAYLTTALDPVTTNPVNNLFDINLATGVATTPTLHTASAIEALAFGPGNTLYALDRGTNNPDSTTELYSINTTNGAQTLIGSTGVAVGSPTGSLTFGPSGSLYATLDDKLYTLSTTTGAATAVGSSDPTLTTGFGSISGIAFFSAVPEPSSVVMAAAGLLAVGIIARRRDAPRRP